MILTTPTLLTLGRLVLLLPIMGAFYAEWAWAALGLYIIAALTDFLDGWVARKLNQISAFGTFLDPISDKIFVGALLIFLAGFGRLEGLWMIPAAVILAREFLISGLREFLGPHDIKMPVTKLAKWKTAVQMAALGLLIAGPIAPAALAAGHWALLAAAALTVITGWGYMKAGLEVMKKMP